jgi:hypothetical protein
MVCARAGVRQIEMTNRVQSGTALRVHAEATAWSGFRLNAAREMLLPWAAISFYRNLPRVPIGSSRELAAKTACTQAVFYRPALQTGDLMAANRLGPGGLGKARGNAV